MKPRHVVGAAAALAGSVAAYATLVEPRWLQVTRPTIYIRGLHPDLEGLRIALLTDLHEGTPGAPRLVRRAVRLASREAPDMVALTGDFAVDTACLRAVMTELRSLEAPLGVYGVPGNHDHELGIGAWHHALSGEAIHDLTNRMVMLKRGRARLCVAGVDDLDEGVPRLDHLPPPEERDLTILLAHNPDQAERSRRGLDAVDLMLSGHTHGGQVRLPGLRAPVNPARYGELYEAGLRRRPWTQVYTSRGVGTSGYPLRLFARPEVARLTLTGAARPRR